MSAHALKGLRPQAYEHPSDAAALNVLANTAGFDALMRKLNAWGMERIIRVDYTGSHLLVTPDSFPDLHATLETAAERLDLPAVPELYLRSAPTIDAKTAGVERPIIVLYSAAVEHLTDDELLFVLAREMGHIKSGHILYHQMEDALPAIARVLGATTLGLSDVLSMGIEFALTYWKRMASFTADRAGLLACQDVDTVFRTMMKIAGLPPKYFATANTEDFLRQARHFESLDNDRLTRLIKWTSGASNDHPWMVMRAQQLLKWVDDGQYEAVIGAPQRIPVQLPAGVRGFCNQCGQPLKGAEAFCPGCGCTLQPEPRT